MISAQHGTTNDVRLDLERRRVVKRYPKSGSSALWRSPRREAAALRVAASTGLVPRLKRVAANELEFTLLDGNSYPQAYSTTTERRALSKRAGRALRTIHECRPAGDNAADWSALRLPGDFQGSSWPVTVRCLADKLCVALSAVVPELTEMLKNVCLDMSSWCADLPDPRWGLVHGDFGGANLLATPLGVVDWEWGFLGDVSYDLVRHAWLLELGRNHYLYDDRDTRAAFLDGYEMVIDPGAAAVQLRVYGTLMALSHSLHGALLGLPILPFTDWLEQGTGGNASDYCGAIS